MVSSLVRPDVLFVVVLVFSVFKHSDSYRSCPSGFNSYLTGDGDDFLCLKTIIIKNDLSSNQASYSCQRDGGYLPAITSAEIQAKYISAAAFMNIDPYITWIGLTRIGTSDVYKWADGTDVTWTAWAVDQPNTAIPNSCVVAKNDTTSGKVVWESYACDEVVNVAGYICQARLQCSAGLYSSTTTRCTECDGGQYSGFDAVSCLSCSAGRYSSYGNQTGIKYDDICPQSSGSANTTDCCSACSSGKYINAIASTSEADCRLCPDRYYSPEGSSQCYLIPAGMAAATSGSIPQKCPAGSYSQAGASSCTLCPLETYSSKEGSRICQPCPKGRLTTSEGCTSEDQCVSPNMNFIQGVITLVITVALTWVYVFRGRFAVVAFMRKYRVAKPLKEQALRIASYMMRYEYKGESLRMYYTDFRILRVFLFFFISTSFTVSLVALAYLGAMGKIAFKATILVVGLKFDVPILNKLKGLGDAIANIFQSAWFALVLFAPFAAFLDFLVSFEFSLDAVNVTCTGSEAPSKLLTNLFVLGVVICLIQSDFAIYKCIVHDGLASSFEKIAMSVSYKTWSPQHFDFLLKKQETGYSLWSAYCGTTVSKSASVFDFHLFGILFVGVLVQLVNAADLFQGSLQWLASKVSLGDFAEHYYVAHPWDEECNVVAGFPNFDTGLALGASLVAWVMLFPSLYLISSVLIPGLPPFAEPFAVIEKDTENLGPSRGTDKTWSKLWKLASIAAPDLWCAETAYWWLRLLSRNTPYDGGDRSPSIAQVERLVVDPTATRPDKIENAPADPLQASMGNNEQRGGEFVDFNGEYGPSNIELVTSTAPRQNSASSERNTTWDDHINPLHSGSVSLDAGIEPRDVNYTGAGQQNKPEKPKLFYGLTHRLNLNARAEEVIRELEKPLTPLFRVVVSYTEDERQILRLYRSNRIVHRTVVWEEVPLDNLEGKGYYTLIVIDTKSCKVLSSKSYDSWSYDRPDSAEEITTDLGACSPDSTVIFCKWGVSKDEDVVAAEKSMSQMTSFMAILEDFKANALPPKPKKRGSVLEAGAAPTMKRRSSVLTEAEASNVKPIRSSKELHSQLMGDKGKCVLKFAEAIAWCGGDSSKLASSSSFIMVGTPLKGYDLQSILDEMYRTGVPIAYQQWQTEDGRIFETNADGCCEVTDSEGALLGEDHLCDILLRGPLFGQKRLQNIRNESRGQNGRVGCIDQRSFLLAPLASRDDVEAIEWKEYSITSLPPYLTLCDLEAAEVSKAMGIQDVNVQRALLVIFILGFGHLATEVGRRAYYIVIWKFYRFILLCFGYWTDDVVDLYEMHQELEQNSLVWRHPFYVVRSPTDNNATSVGIAGAGADMEGGNREQNKNPIEEPAANELGDFFGEQWRTVWHEAWLTFAHHFEETKEISNLGNTTLKNMYRQDYKSIISTIVSTRSTILQILPGFAILSIFANITSATPMFVYSKKLALSLPEMVCRDPEGIARRTEEEYTDAIMAIRTKELHEHDFCIEVPSSIIAESSTNHVARHVRLNIENYNERARNKIKSCVNQEPLLVKEWVIKIKTIMFFVTQSRLIMFLYELGNFCLIMTLLFGMNNTDSYMVFVGLSVILIVPMAIVHTLSVYIIVGKILSVTDADIAYFNESCADFLMGRWECAGDLPDLDEEAEIQAGSSMESEFYYDDFEFDFGDDEEGDEKGPLSAQITGLFRALWGSSSESETERDDQTQ